MEGTEVDKSRMITIDPTKIDKDKIADEGKELVKNLKTLVDSMASLIEDAPEAVGLYDIGIVVSIASAGSPDLTACFGAGPGIMTATAALCDNVMHTVMHNRDESKKDSKENNG